MTNQDMATAERLDGLISDIKSFKTQFDVFRFMKRVTELYGARAFMVLNMPGATAQELSSSSIITNWPADLLTEFDQGALLSGSPVLAHLRRASIPLLFDIDDVAIQRDPKSGEVSKALFHRFRMNRGAYFPVHDATGARGAVSFAGDREPFSTLEMTQLAYIAAHVFNRLAEIREMDSRNSDMLTDRELDCLNWTAAGKTSVEIAEILTLSEHTINHYLNRATKKLDAVNRTQAVAKALRLGLIK
ncbi:helix-turn-helix transcriptional regulator [Rhizobium rosettiformans]|uniref:LuxR family transcriptional regulator n=2 Tax=Rhizobium rosettiformans TaxID=1368430 RepID=A0A4S8PVQ1_9HYPH|nr:autoinducer binding domain-containing protein [Hyphomicrobiales bacterium]MBB5274654.1 DNA-binding CsgD family transcriptional regulator [Rhizobium rosettiformans]MDR7028786.1 DNA-binding CsgD family transcriptional regulator [Rhizobium rosettiformans]MDR7063932.1 DNA-binding CsgD family transcriptional regulator [Rhizobium rosettiformans]THV34045.1 LuxR family transcriptional regulator [Rhizobium rosettiformans W3]